MRLRLNRGWVVNVTSIAGRVVERSSLSLGWVISTMLAGRRVHPAMLMIPWPSRVRLWLAVYRLRLTRVGEWCCRRRTSIDIQLHRLNLWLILVGFFGIA